MSQLINLTKRNIKVYFSDKGMFFTSLITPIILLVLYATFLANVYRDSFLSAWTKLCTFNFHINTNCKYCCCNNMLHICLFSRVVHEYK